MRKFHQSSSFKFLTGILIGAIGILPATPVVLGDPPPAAPDACTSTYTAMCGSTFVLGQSGFLLSPSTGNAGDLSVLSATICDPTNAVVNAGAGAAAFEWIATEPVVIPGDVLASFNQGNFSDTTMNVVAGRIIAANGQFSQYVVGLQLTTTYENEQAAAELSTFAPIEFYPSAQAALDGIPSVKPFDPLVIVPDLFGNPSPGGYRILPGPDSNCGTLTGCSAKCDCLYNQCIRRNYRDTHTDDSACLATIGAGAAIGCFAGFVGCLVGAAGGCVTAIICVEYQEKKMRDYAQDCYQDWVYCQQTNCGVEVR